MKTDRRLISKKGRLAAALSFGLALLLGGPDTYADTVKAPGMHYFRIGTGTSDGTYFTIGGLIANALSSPPGAQPCTHGGS